jgi:hypothetical protein
LAFFSTAKNRYSKPFTNIWQLIELFYKQKNKPLTKKTSVIIGHNAGRLTSKGRKLDRSCVDRAFAHNIGITFATPEAFFLDSKKYTFWEWCPRVLSDSNKQALSKSVYRPPVIYEELSKLPRASQYTIIITGVVSCGKSTLAAKTKRKWDSDYNSGVIERISENSNNISQIIEKADMLLKNKQSVLIDMACENINITQVIKTSMENKTPILVIEIKTSRRIAQLLDFMKVQMTRDSSIILQSPYAWKAYYKQYTRPSYDEIPCVGYIEFPLIANVCDEFWYEYSY